MRQAQRATSSHPGPADLDDIQGLVYRGWAEHRFAGYVFAKLGEAKRSRQWLAKLGQELSPASQTRGSGRIQLALSPRGLAALGVPDEVVAQLPHEARAGMRARARVLGDDSPSGWTLGAEDDLDVLVMVFAPSDGQRAAMVDAQRDALQSAGARLLPTELSWPLEGREHFGFADGLSQPFVRGVFQAPRRGEDLIAAGEIILGYPNEYGRTPHSPHWGDFDLGRNGSYLVFRKLEQHVERFWGYLYQRAAELCGDDPASAPQIAERLAAKMMGRWRDGSSLVRAPDWPHPGALGDNLNAFGYLAEDRDGLRCPISSHVRRANPRDAHGGSAAKSLHVIARHRILRRGRAYGPPLADDLARAGTSDDRPRGLYFLSLQTSIARGFEFIQQTWVNNQGFGGLCREADPIAGNGDCPFTIPEDPVRLRLSAVPKLVTTRGGGYFFLPSRSAVARIAQEPARSAAARPS
jgi:Dyp-type peroxidase family